MGFSQANFEWMYYLLSSPYIGRHAGMGAQTHAMSVRSDWQRSLSIDLKSQSQWLVWLDYLKRKKINFMIYINQVSYHFWLHLN